MLDYLSFSGSFIISYHYENFILLQSSGFFVSKECTEVRFASFLSGGMTTRAVINPPEKKLAKRTSVEWVAKGVASEVHDFITRPEREV
jgi:hypothetical protein